MDDERRRADETPSAPYAAPVRALEERLSQQIAELEALGADWDGYGARPIDASALRFALGLALASSRTGLPEPELFPVATGGVQLEWCAGEMELELEIEPGGTSAVFVGDDRRTGDRFDGQFPEARALFQLAFSRLAASR